MENLIKSGSDTQMIFSTSNLEFKKRYSRSFNSFLLALLLVFVSCVQTKQGTQFKENSDNIEYDLNEVSVILSQLPAANETEWYWLNDQLFDRGAQGVQSLITMLNATGRGDDSNIRYALNGLAKFVSRPGAENERMIYEETLVKELKKSHPAPSKVFLMEQLELVGSDVSVPVLQLFIGDEILHDPAVHALRAIGTDVAVRSLVSGISKTEGKQRVALVKSIGDLKATSPFVIQEILPIAESGDPQMAGIARYALANTGSPNAITLLSNPEFADEYILLSKRLAEEGYQSESVQISREILNSNYNITVWAAALKILIQQEGSSALNELLDAAQDPDIELRSAALELAVNLEGQDVTEAFVSLLGEVDPAIRVDFINMLGSRGDTAAWEAIAPYLTDRDFAVRKATIASAVSLAGNNVLDDLVDLLVQAQQSEEIVAIKAALLQLPTEPLLDAVADKLSETSGDSKIAIIEILAERQGSEFMVDLLEELNESNAEVRSAIFHSLSHLATPEDLPRLLSILSDESLNDKEQQAVQTVIAELAQTRNGTGLIIDAIHNSNSERKVLLLLEILPKIGGSEALTATIEATESTDITVQTLARKMLAKWPDASAVSPLFQAYSTAPDSERGKLLNGYIQLVVDSKYSSADKVTFLTDIMAETSSADGKNAILEAIASLQTPEALRAITKYFNDSELREKSIQEVARILAEDNSPNSINGTQNVLSVLESTNGRSTRDEIEQYINTFKSQRKAIEGFTSLFNGQDLSGWTGNKDAYTVRDGELIFQSVEGGNLYTEQQFSNFRLYFEFKLSEGANSGLAIRSPLEGDPAYEGMELQILDNTAQKYEDLEPYQYHGSVYGVVPAIRGLLKPTGEWNIQEVTAQGSQITVKLNGVTIVNADIEKAANPQTIDGRDHPGLFRESGHIGFLGHSGSDEVAFRNIFIRNLSNYQADYSNFSDNSNGMNQPPQGFTSLFNGENLNGWKGLVGNPESRADMSEEELKKAQKVANIEMEKHWSVRDGILYFDGHGESIATEKDYKDFEMLVDWKIEPSGDSGVYLRGSPQVQIWDITEWPQGSGGLYNNQKNLSDPLVVADNSIGEWNSMRIRMIGERVTTYLNGELVVPDVVMENYWDRSKPIYSQGQLELQSHETPLYFRNIFIREIPRTEKLFNGIDLTGWERVGGNAGGWHVNNHILYTEGRGEEWEKGTGGGWLSTTEMFDNFRLEFEYRLPKGGNSGIFIRAPHQGDPAFQGFEIQLLDDYAEEFEGLNPWQYTGSIYDIQAPSQSVSKAAGEWQHMVIVADGPDIQVILNDKMIINTNLINYMDRVDEHPGLKRREGYIGLQNHNTQIEYRNIKITEFE